MEELLKGFQYIFGEDLKTARYVMRRCETLLESMNFQEVVTPMLVDYKIVVSEVDRPISPANSDIVFKLHTTNGETLALKYENTLPVCKFYIENIATSHSSSSTKLYYVTPLFRNEKEVDINARLRQFYQVGYEIIGSEDNTLDSIYTGSRLLSSLGLTHTVAISNVNLTSEIFRQLGFSHQDRDNLRQIFESNNEPEFIKFLGHEELSTASKELLIRLFNSKSATLDEISQLREMLALAGFQTAIYCLDEIVKVANELAGINSINYKVDLTLIRSAKMYSGIIFQYYFDGATRECGGGGEYNRVIRSLGGGDVCACGAAFGVERIIHEYNKSR